MSTLTQQPDAVGTNVLSVALIGPEERRRGAIASALVGSQGRVTREFSLYPRLDDIPQLLEENYDIILVELDSNPEHALELVENICGASSATVMVYSARADSELLVRCMRAGAREFLTQPFAPGAIDEALIRASVRRPAVRAAKKTLGKLLVFAGVKGGSGVTTVAVNFAILLAQISGQRTLLIDLDLPLGDAALELGISTQFSTAIALQNFNRLDTNFLSKLLTRHGSGLNLLAAPDKYTAISVSEEAIERLLSLARQDFDYVVVDAGSRIGPTCQTLFQAASTVYLVTQIGVSELRNANRLISEFFASGRINLEIVLNRYIPRALGIDEKNITKALTRPASWKIPGDYPAAWHAQNTAMPLALKDSPISRVIRQMARAASGISEAPEKKKRFGIF